MALFSCIYIDRLYYSLNHITEIVILNTQNFPVKELPEFFYELVVVVLPEPFRGMWRGGIPRRPNILARRQGLDQRSKMEEVVPKWRAEVAQMRDNPEDSKFILLTRPCA